jgi:hypothetical protein
MNSNRRHQPALRVAPAHQRLHAQRRARGGVEQRLEEQLELLLLERLAQARHQLVALADGAVEFGRVLHQLACWPRRRPRAWPGRRAEQALRRGAVLGASARMPALMPR